MCLDHRKRKLFVGDQAGRITCINVKNGARMKKFKKSKKNRDGMDDVSSLYYWGGDGKNMLICSSWDKKVRLYDDNAKKEQDSKRFTMSKHTQPVNYLDFRLDPNTKNEKNASLCASCSDDCSVIIYNYASYRQEGHLIGQDISEVKVCKFLGQTDCLVSSDIEGVLYFWAITPSPRKGELLCSVHNENESEVGTITTFPIKGIDFDEE